MVVQVFQKMAFSIIVSFLKKSIVFYHDQVENAVQIISDVLPYDGNEAPELLEQEVAEGVLRRPDDVQHRRNHLGDVRHRLDAQRLKNEGYSLQDFSVVSCECRIANDFH